MVEIQNAVMVVAHPDDEILWFSSILNQCKSVLVCFGPSATSKESWDGGRAVLMETYPLTNVRFLKLRQSEAFQAANWSKPKETGSGLELRRRKRSLYEKNAETLLRILEVELKHESLVFTHNPWGEYGNEEHVQVFRVLAGLRASLGFDLFVNSYVSNKTAKLMSRSEPSLDDTPLVCETDTVLAQRLKNLYLENNCWTWMDDYDWPGYESFYRVGESDETADPRTRASVPLNHINQNFVHSPLKKLASKTLPTSVKSHIKRMYKID